MSINNEHHSGPGVMLISYARSGRSDAHYRCSFEWASLMSITPALEWSSLVMLVRAGVMLIRMSITNEHHSGPGVMLISDARSGRSDAH